jgi:hypothetical protein
LPPQSEFIARKRATLLIPSGPTGMHLFVIMTNRCANGFHLLLSVTSVRDGMDYDTTCVFRGGEHPFISQKSYVFYRSAEQKMQSALERGVEKGLFVPRPDMAEEPFAAMCDGITRSDFIKPWAVEYYQRNSELRQATEQP